MVVASQAAARGYGKLLSDREYPNLCSLQLRNGGNIIINTSTSPELPPAHTEATTMGHRFLPPSNLLNRNFPTYSLQETGLRDGSGAQTRPSYSQVIKFNRSGLSSRPPPQTTPLSPETHVPPELIDASEKGGTGHTGKPMTDTSATIHLDTKTAQRTLEQYSGDLDAAKTDTNRIEPLGPQQSRREGMQENGPGYVDDGLGTGLRVQVNRDGDTSCAAEVQSHRVMTDTTCQAIPSATCPNIHSPSVTEPGLNGRRTPENRQEILLQTPNGEAVPEHEIRWGPNPHSRAGGDNLQLLEIVPGHHQFIASFYAQNLCKMVGSDPRSQFYKTPPIVASPTSEPPYLRGNGRTIKRQNISRLPSPSTGYRGKGADCDD